MSLYWITGQAGTGKSSVCQELRNRGYEAYDSDDNMARWVNKNTGYIPPKSSVKPEQRTSEFLAAHDWKVPQPAVEELARQAKGKTVFLCGVGGNEGEIINLFRAAFALIIDDDTMKHRLVSRTGNNWGKRAEELELTLSWQESARKDYKKYGHIIIDATKPLNSVVDDIITTVDRFEPSS